MFRDESGWFTHVTTYRSLAPRRESAGRAVMPSRNHNAVEVPRQLNAGSIGCEIRSGKGRPADAGPFGHSFHHCLECCVWFDVPEDPRWGAMEGSLFFVINNVRDESGLIRPDLLSLRVMFRRIDATGSADCGCTPNKICPLQARSARSAR